MAASTSTSASASSIPADLISTNAPLLSPMHAPVHKEPTPSLASVVASESASSPPAPVSPSTLMATFFSSSSSSSTAAGASTSSTLAKARPVGVSSPSAVFSADDISAFLGAVDSQSAAAGSSSSAASSSHSHAHAHPHPVPADVGASLDFFAAPAAVAASSPPASAPSS